MMMLMMMQRFDNVLVLVLLLLLADVSLQGWIVPADAFTCCSPRTTTTTPGAAAATGTISSSSSGVVLSSSSSSYSDSGASSDSVALPEIDFRLFLTQRTIQNFMFLLSQTRDMYTIRWVDNFTQPVVPEIKGVELGEFDDNSSIPVDPFQNRESGTAYGGLVKPGSHLLVYHGLDALSVTLFPTWESYFENLLNEPTEVLEISSGNPGTPFRSFEVEIDPPRLCSRMLAVRSQIAQEWAKDLDYMAKMETERVFSSYWGNVKNNRSSAGFDREGLWHLEYIQSEESDYSPSPLRKGSFDLLKLLATQESIHRVLSNKSPFMNSGGEKNEGDADTDAAVNSIVSKEFLRIFYLEHLDSHFRGYVRYGRADDFIEELMLSSPRLVTSTTSAAGQDGGSREVTGLVDPLRLAKAVMRERESVAMEWKELASQSPREHIKIQKMQLDKMHQQPAEEKGAEEPFRPGLVEADDFYESRAIPNDAGDSSSCWQ